MSPPPVATRSEVTRLSIDAVRVLSMDAVQAARSGHPGTPMALAPAAYLLFTRHLRHNPENPEWPDRDRFILSAGHASMLLYSALHLSGYDLPLDELVRFRQWGSHTPGHPEYRETPGVETTTGPLGQGVANSVGMALAERWLANRFNRPDRSVVDHWTYAICSDGDLMEGISHEAAELAGHQKLGKLIWIFDDNQITIDGGTDLSTSVDQARRFQAYGWHVQHVEDGNDLEALDRALEKAREETDRPSLIVLRTTIGEGSPNLAGHHSTHGAPLGEEEIQATKENLDYPSLEPFHIDPRALSDWRRARERGKELEGEWRDRMAGYRADHPDAARELEEFLSGQLPSGWDQDLKEGSSGDEGADEATRASSGKAIQKVAPRVPNLVGGSADLTGSNQTEIKGAEVIQASTPGGRNLHYGVREHAMGGIMNGMALHGGLRPFGGTFLIFSDYMRPSIRLAALMGLPVIYVFSHDSIGLGEDGPTHQPVEHLPALRAIPNLLDLRPGDAAETEAAWRVALARKEGPTFLALTRQKVPQLPREGNDAGVERGGYIFREASTGTPTVILLASGSELHLAVDAKTRLEEEGPPTRVVSLPPWQLFRSQPKEYREQVLPPTVTNRVSVEAAATLGWERWVGSAGASVGLDRFGASAPSDTLYQELGITVDAVLAQARNLAGS